MSDFIDRGAAIDAVTDTAIKWGVIGGNAILLAAKDAIRAIPAVPNADHIGDANKMVAAPAQGRVKALVWHDYPDGTSHDDACQYEITPDGEYVELCRVVTGGRSYMMQFGGCDRLKEAKAAAQADYDASILSAFDAPPADEVARLHHDIMMWQATAKDRLTCAERAEAERDAANARAAWQPISTAPNDGTKILCWRWVPAVDLGDSDLAYEVMWWGNNWGDDPRGDGWLSDYESEPDHWPSTHWMPLPVAPFRAALAQEGE